MIVEELQERLARYKRVQNNKDVQETIEELLVMFNVNGSVFPVLNCPNATEMLWAREGIRTFTNKLGKLVEETERALKDVETNKGDIDE